MFNFLPSRAAIWAGLVALSTLALAWLRYDARRDAERDLTSRDNENRLNAIKHKQEIDRDVETQDDIALIDRLTRR